MWCVVMILFVVGIIVLQVVYVQVMFNFVNVDIDQVVKVIGVVIGKIIIVDFCVKGQFNFVVEWLVLEDQVLKMLQLVLCMQGFVFVQDYGVLKVVLEVDVKLQGVLIYVGNVLQVCGDQVIMQVFELYNELVNNLLFVLWLLILLNNMVMVYLVNNMIVVIDYVDNVCCIVQIILGIDSVVGVQVQVVMLCNVNVIDFVVQMQKMFDLGVIGNSDVMLKVLVMVDLCINLLLLCVLNGLCFVVVKCFVLQFDVLSVVFGNMYVVLLCNVDVVKFVKMLCGMFGKGGNDSGLLVLFNDVNSFNQNGGLLVSGNFLIGMLGILLLLLGGLGGLLLLFYGSGFLFSGGIGSGGLFGGDKDKSGDDNQLGGMIQVDLVVNLLIIIVFDLVYWNLCLVIDQFDVWCVQVYIEVLIVELNLMMQG